MDAQNLKILIADDNESLRTYAKKVINQITHSVDILEATNGQQALELLVQHVPALAIFDGEMPPGQTGPQIVAEGKRLGLSTQYVVASGSDDLLAEAKKLGAATLRKPYSPLQLQEYVARALKQPSPENGK